MSEPVNLINNFSIVLLFLLAGTTTGFFFLPFPVSDLLIHPLPCLLLLGLWLVLHGVFLQALILIGSQIIGPQLSGVAPLMVRVCLNLAVLLLPLEVVVLGFDKVVLSQV